VHGRRQGWPEGARELAGAAGGCTGLVGPDGGGAGMVSPVTGDDVGGSGNLKSKSLFFAETILLVYKDDPIPRIFKNLGFCRNGRCRPAEGGVGDLQSKLPPSKGGEIARGPCSDSVFLESNFRHSQI
jgi:hypothetical protein